MPNIVITGLDEQIKSSLPGSLAEQFTPLFKDIFWLGAKWHEYDALFGSGKPTVDLLNRAAGYLFLIIQDTLWDDLLLHLSRLTGPEKTLSKDNLTIRRLPGLIPDSELRQKIDALVASCVDHCDFVKDHRNKRLAHHDLGMAVEGREKDLTGVSRAQIRQAVDQMRNIVGTVFEHYTDSTFIFGTEHMSQNADTLIAILRRAEHNQGPL